MDRPIESNYNSHVAYTRALEEYCDTLAQPAQEPVAWMHRMDNTEGIKANGKGIVSITQKRKHPFGKPGVDFSKSYPVTSTPLYTTPPAAQPAPDLSKLKPENAQKMHEWIADGSFAQRAIDTMFDLSQEITKLKAAQPPLPAQEPDELTIAYMSGLYDGKKKRPWVGLTDEEASWCQAPSTIQTWKRIEAKLKEKNT